MKYQNLEINIIRNEMFSQEKLLESINHQIASLVIKRKIAETTIALYKSMLPDLPENSINEQNYAIPTPQKTYEIIASSDEPAGIQIKTMIEEYEKMGIKTHGRVVFRYVKELMEKGKIIQTNPDALRSRLYKALDKEF